MTERTRLPFSRRTTIVVLAVAVPSFVLFLVALVLGPEWAPVESSGATSWSSSAVGHHALYEVLRELDLPVQRSRHASAGRAGEDGVLLLLDPWPDTDRGLLDREQLAAALTEARTIVVALPKWEVRRRVPDDGWVAGLEPRPTRNALDVLATLGVGDVEVQRLAAPTPSEGWSTQGICPPPVLADSPQLITGPGVDPWVARAEGTLVGEVRSATNRIIVIADPDVLTPRGLGLGGNAALVVRTIEHVRGSGPVILDEVLHGFALEPSLWRALFRMPLLTLTLHGLLLGCVVLLSSWVRRRPPLPAPEPPARGTTALLEQATGLLARHGDTWGAADHYTSAAWHDVVAGLRIPRDVDRASALAWVAAREERRELSDRFASIDEDRRGRRGNAVALAQRVYHWKETLLDGTV
ncbi:MAG: DUF4350 domain-containing protein [Planctomycetota bacterium]